MGCEACQVEEAMNWFTELSFPVRALFSFGTMVLIDICYVLWVRWSSHGKPYKAALASAGITVIGSAGMLLIVSDWRLIFPEAAGAIVGTLLAMKFDGCDMHAKSPQAVDIKKEGL